jgi:hypothetical protein
MGARLVAPPGSSYSFKDLTKCRTIKQKKTFARLYLFTIQMTSNKGKERALIVPVNAKKETESTTNDREIIRPYYHIQHSLHEEMLAHSKHDPTAVLKQLQRWREADEKLQQMTLVEQADMADYVTSRFVKIATDEDLADCIADVEVALKSRDQTRPPSFVVANVAALLLASAARPAVASLAFGLDLQLKTALANPPRVGGCELTYPTDEEVIQNLFNSNVDCQGSAANMEGSAKQASVENA